MARLGVKINLAIKLAFPIKHQKTGMGWTSLKIKYIIEKCLISYAFSSEICIYTCFKNACKFSWHPTQLPDFTVAATSKRLKYKYNNCKLRIYKDKISIIGDNYLVELRNTTNYYRGKCELFRKCVTEIRESIYDLSVVYLVFRIHTSSTA